MLAASNRKHIAIAGRLGSGPALGPECQVSCADGSCMQIQITEITP